MPIERGHGSILCFRAAVDAIVNTVNTEGVMGKGLALQIKQAFPDVFQAYAQSCAAGAVAIGRMHVVQRRTPPQIVINFPTKQLWRHPSKIEYIAAGLLDLVVQVRARGIRSIAVPPLGCGNGGLDWDDVRPRIESAFAALPEVRVVIFEPGSELEPMQGGQLELALATQRQR